MSTGVNDRIAVPAACLPYLLDHFKLPKRGKVYIKGKGDMIVHFCTARKTTEQIKANLEARAAKKINSTDAWWYCFLMILFLLLVLHHKTIWWHLNNDDGLSVLVLFGKF